MRNQKKNKIVHLLSLWHTKNMRLKVTFHKHTFCWDARDLLSIVDMSQGLQTLSSGSLLQGAWKNIALWLREGSGPLISTCADLSSTIPLRMFGFLQGYFQREVKTSAKDQSYWGTIQSAGAYDKSHITEVLVRNKS